MIQEQPTEAEAKAALMQCDAPKPWGNDTSWMRAADPEPRKGFRQPKTSKHKYQTRQRRP